MTQIDFYILADDSSRKVETIVCTLVEKAFKQDNFICIQCNSSEQAIIIDELLWKLKPESFLPHKIIDPGSKVQEVEMEAELESKFYPIIINTHESLPENYNPQNRKELLINLSINPPDFYSQFHRLIELVGTNDEIKQAARQRYKNYKERGYPMNTHNLS